MPNFFLGVINTFIFLTLFASTADASPQVPANPDIKTPANHKHLIVFIHGVGGDKDSWKNSSTGFYWPDGLSKDPDFNDAYVYIFNYGSKCNNGMWEAIFGSNRSDPLSVYKISQSLKSEIENVIAAWADFESISFIVHSLGGIVVREFILSEYPHISPKIPIANIVSLSTPSKGSYLANIAAAFCTNPQLEALKKNGPYIDNLVDRWDSGANPRFQDGFFQSAAYEGKDTGLSRVVKADEAKKFGIAGHRQFDKDHIEIAKPTGNRCNNPSSNSVECDTLYTEVKKWLKQQPKYIEQLSNQRKTEKEISELITTHLENHEKSLIGDTLLSSKNHMASITALCSDAKKKNRRSICMQVLSKMILALPNPSPERNIYSSLLEKFIFSMENSSSAKLHNWNFAIKLVSGNETIDDLDPAIDSDLLSLLGKYKLDLHEYDKAIDYFQQALKYDLKNFGPEHPNVARDQDNLGNALYSKGQYDEAIENFEQARKNDLKNFGPEHPNVARDQDNLGKALYSKGQYKAAIDYYESSLASNVKNFGQSSTQVLFNENYLGKAWLHLGSYDKAIGYFERSLNSSRINYGNKHPFTSQIASYMGRALISKGRHDEAIEYFEQALKNDSEIFGSNHPDVANDNTNLGFAWYSKGQYDKALEYYKNALAININTLGPEHPYTSTSYNNLGAVLHHVADYDEAIKYFEQALKNNVKIFGQKHPSVTMGFNNMGAAWHSKGQYDKAIKFYEDALRLDIEIFGQEHPDVVRDQNNLGKAWYSKKLYAEAIEYFERALKIVEKAGLSNLIGVTKQNIEAAKAMLNY